MICTFLLPLVFWLAALTFTATSAASAAAAAAKVLSPSTSSYLDPHVEHYRRVLSPSACGEIIERAEQIGFSLGPDSIDYGEDASRYQASQDISVVNNGEVLCEDLWDLVQPWVPRFTKIIQEQQDPVMYQQLFPDEPNKVPKVDWVFLRKYSPSTKRNSLKLHCDLNLHTMNVALNDGYKGGGLFYVKPPVELNRNDEQHASNRDEQKEKRDLAHSEAPDIWDEYKTYEWLEGLKRHNTSDVVFPQLGVGDTLVHNYTVWHAIAPIEEGTKYSLVLFFDMDNPVVKDVMLEQVTVTFHHEITSYSIDLVWITTNANGREEMSVIREKFPPLEDHLEITYPGEIFRAVLSGTDTMVAEIIVDREQSNYEIVPRGSDEIEEECVV